MNRVGRTRPGILGSSNSDSTKCALLIACSASSCAMPCLSVLSDQVTATQVVYERSGHLCSAKGPWASARSVVNRGTLASPLHDCLAGTSPVRPRQFSVGCPRCEGPQRPAFSRGARPTNSSRACTGTTRLSPSRPSSAIPASIQLRIKADVTMLRTGLSGVDTFDGRGRGAPAVGAGLDLAARRTRPPGRHRPRLRPRPARRHRSDQSAAHRSPVNRPAARFGWRAAQGLPLCSGRVRERLRGLRAIQGCECCAGRRP